MRAGLFRTLAEDDDRVAYWVRHVRSGVVLSELSAVAALVYALLTHTPGRHSPFILAMAAGVVLASPAAPGLPHDRWMRDHRGPVLFYLWSLTDTVVISLGRPARRRRLQPAVRAAVHHAGLHGRRLPAARRRRRWVR